MTRDEQPEDVLAENQLSEFADAWLGGNLLSPTNDLETTFARVQRVMGKSQQHSSMHVDSINKEPIMHQQQIATLEIPRTRRDSSASSRFAAGVRRWQPALSLVVMLALIGGLVAIAWDRQMRDPEPTPTMLAALQDDATPAAQHCTPPAPSATEEEARAFSFEDWSPPQYYATGYADAETRDRAVQLFESFWLCGSEPTPYLSTRLQHIFMYDELAPDQQAEIEAYLCLPREQDVLQYFPLTLNAQRIDPIWQGYPRSQWIHADVYLLGDGRYGMAMGKLTTEIIRDPSMALEQDSLRFVAFVEQNGQLYIDESFLAFTGDPSLYSHGQMTGDCD